MKAQLGEQIIFSESINVTLKCTTIIETEFVTRRKHWRHEQRHDVAIMCTIYAIAREKPDKNFTRKASTLLQLVFSAVPVQRSNQTTKQQLEEQVILMGSSMPIWGVQRLFRLSLYRGVNNNVMNDCHGYNYWDWVCTAVYTMTLWMIVAVMINETEFVRRCKQWRCEWSSRLWMQVLSLKAFAIENLNRTRTLFPLFHYLETVLNGQWKVTTRKRKTNIMKIQSGNM